MLRSLVTWSRDEEIRRLLVMMALVGAVTQPWVVVAVSASRAKCFILRLIRFMMVDGIDYSRTGVLDMVDM